MAGENITAPPSSSGSYRTRSRSESSGSISGGDRIRLSLDLVTASRRHLSFIRSFAASSLHHHPPTLRRSIRRYEELWMPLIAELTSAAAEIPMLLPPHDVQWVWHCHRLNHATYREYCASRFGNLIDRPAIFDDENEDYAADRCREIWAVKYPSEPFDLEIPAPEDGDGEGIVELFEIVAKYRSLHSNFADPFVSETVYLVAAKRRYLDFLHLAKRFEGRRGVRLVPTSDILLMWLAHQSFPGRYARDTEGLGEVEKRVVGFGDPAAAKEEEVEETSRAWEEAYDEPYERSGAEIDAVAKLAARREVFNWEAVEVDVNRRYKVLQPRLLMEVYVFLKGELEGKRYGNKTFLRLRTLRSHRSLKIDEEAYNLSSKHWRKRWHLYCEFGTRGIVIELRRRGNGCLRSSKLLKTVVFSWIDLLRATTFTLTREVDMQMRAMTSVTPPIQAPYLLKCVPDRVTDDSGAMISDVILRMKGYHPQEGRWLSRTVLDHARKECFVVRIRVGRGIWRRGAETPTAVKLEDRITEVREGSWSYIASSVGFAPEKVVGTATPKKENLQEKKTTWCLSTGELLTIRWEDGLSIHLENEDSTQKAILLGGRRLQYQVKKANSSNKQDEVEDQYFTLVRTTAEHPDGKATALLNWKLLAVEFSPEEDAVLVLLLCMSIARTISEIRREDAAGLLARRRFREVQTGKRDLGSVMLPSSSSSLSPHLQPWYLDAAEVLASAERNDGREPITKYSPADGKELLYRQAIIQ
ncbi:glycine-rich domain-containing protein 2 [Typha latifolia]|uniref:glycine-rich domain-containing protein 2 n=1 Tax=Typha latifolia TaxID=4733 RepID=UPI003C2C4BD5